MPSSHRHRRTSHTDHASLLYNLRRRHTRPSCETDFCNNGIRHPSRLSLRSFHRHIPPVSGRTSKSSRRTRVLHMDRHNRHWKCNNRESCDMYHRCGCIEHILLHNRHRLHNKTIGERTSPTFHIPRMERATNTSDMTRVRSIFPERFSKNTHRHHRCIDDVSDRWNRTSTTVIPTYTLLNLRKFHLLRTHTFLRCTLPGVRGKQPNHNNPHRRHTTFSLVSGTQRGMHTKYMLSPSQTPVSKIADVYPLFSS